jgi:DNA-binding protein H-NS
MARRPSLASMSVEDLLQLRNDIALALSGKASELQRQLAALGQDVEVGERAPRGRRGSAMKGVKVAPKYRGPNGETWAGRGVMPSWMAAAIKEGRTREDFLIDKSATAAARPARKRGPARNRRAKK